MAHHTMPTPEIHCKRNPASGWIHGDPTPATPATPTATATATATPTATAALPWPYPLRLPTAMRPGNGFIYVAL